MDYRLLSLPRTGIRCVKLFRSFGKSIESNTTCTQTLFPLISSSGRGLRRLPLLKNGVGGKTSQNCSVLQVFGPSTTNLRLAAPSRHARLVLCVANAQRAARNMVCRVTIDRSTEILTTRGDKQHANSLSEEDKRSDTSRQRGTLSVATESLCALGDMHDMRSSTPATNSLPQIHAHLLRLQKPW